MLIEGLKRPVGRRVLERPCAKVKLALLEGHEGGGREEPGGVLLDAVQEEHELLEGWERLETARDVYGVVFTGDIENETLAVNVTATNARRLELRQAQ